MSVLVAPVWCTSTARTLPVAVKTLARPPVMATSTVSGGHGEPVDHSWLVPDQSP